MTQLVLLAIQLAPQVHPRLVIRPNGRLESHRVATHLTNMPLRVFRVRKVLCQLRVAALT